MERRVGRVMEEKWRGEFLALGSHARRYCEWRQFSLLMFISNKLASKCYWHFGCPKSRCPKATADVTLTKSAT